MRTLWQVVQQTVHERTDTDLLRAFVVHQREEAFSQLVEKHGGMVLSVCQRVLGHRQDAEDAFQATFLVLAQKAGQLHTSSPLSCWLYGVARRIALKARSRRPRHVITLAGLPDTMQEDWSMSLRDDAELRLEIDEAISSLPEAYHSALVLCLLSGLSKAEAARQLGCPEGTVSSRLMRGKELLRQKLVKRGILLASLTALEPLLAPTTVSASLLTSTVSLGMKVALGTTLAVGVSSSILSLAQGASHAMYITKLKTTALCLIAAAGLTAGTTYVAGGWGQEKEARKPSAPQASSKVSPAASSDQNKPATLKANPALPVSATVAALARPSEQLAALTDSNIPLDDYLQTVEETLGLPALVDTTAFRDTFADFDQKKFRQQSISLPRMKGQNADTILRALLDTAKYNEQSAPATYMIRRGTLVIVPQEYILQAANKLMVAFDSSEKECTLVEALERLSQETGVSIILDSRMQEIAQSTLIKSSFRNIRLINAVRLLVSMAEMTVINIDGSLFVSTPDKCQKMEDEISKGGA